MAKSKIVKANDNVANAVAGTYKKVENAVVSGYKKVEDTVVGGYTKIEDKFIEQYLAKDGETVEEILLKRDFNVRVPVAVTSEIGHGKDSKALLIGGNYKIEEGNLPFMA